MEILVNHLTRMRAGFICAAGIDLATSQHSRPVSRNQLTTALLARNGGPFDIGAIVNLDRTVPNGQPPETEDHLFDPAGSRQTRIAAAAELWQRLSAVASPALRQLFGPDLVIRGQHSCGVDGGKGNASLGCLIPAAPPNLFLRQSDGKIRMHVTDGQLDLFLAVTDIRLYGPDHVTPDGHAVQRLDAALKSGLEVILAVGLTRPFAPDPLSPPIHWLQVNNIHLNDGQLWQLG